MEFDIGTKIRIRFTGTVQGEQRLNSTTLVRESTGNQRNHLLFLGSPSVTGAKFAGGTVTAEFDAVVIGKYKQGFLVTTEVREENGFIHFIYLDSTYVTVLPEPAPAPAPVEYSKPSLDFTFPVGTKIRVDIQGITRGSPNSDLKATSEVGENGFSGEYWTHYLFLSSPSVTGDIEDGKESKIRAVFDGTVTGKYKQGPVVTTEVRETSGHTHYLFLNSKAVTVLLPETPASPLSELSTATAPVTVPAPKKEKTTVGIDRYNQIISNDDVENRISELEEGQEYDVVRLRNDEVLATFSERAEAEQYIEDEDYNPERVVVQQQELSEEDAGELSSLRALADEIGSSSWTIYSNPYFTGEWAKGEAKEVLGRYTDTDDWPFTQIDWDEAASERRDSLYGNTVRFDGEYYYYSD